MADRMAASTRSADGRGALPGVLLFGGLLGAGLLAVSQFLTLYGTHIQARHRAIDTATVGSQHAYALLPVAALAALLAYGTWRVLSRSALLGLGALGLLSLLIAVLHDLPYAHKQGLKNLAGHYVLAGNRPEFGLYVETLAAFILIVTCVSGLVLLGPPALRTDRPARARGAASGS